MGALAGPVLYSIVAWAWVAVETGREELGEVHSLVTRVEHMHINIIKWSVFRGTSHRKLDSDPLRAHTPPVQYYKYHQLAKNPAPKVTKSTKSYEKLRKVTKHKL